LDDVPQLFVVADHRSYPHRQLAAGHAAQQVM